MPKAPKTSLTPVVAKADDSAKKITPKIDHYASYAKRLVAKSQGTAPKTKVQKAAIRRKPSKPSIITNPVNAGLRDRKSMAKTSSGAIAAGPDDPKYTELTPLVITGFLAALATSGKPTVVAREQRLHYGSLTALRREDEGFKKSWDQAMADAFDGFEDEVRRRAFNGYQRPVYQQGMLVGHVTEYSDGLALAMIKAGKPELYNPKTQMAMEMGGSIAVAYGHMSDDQLNEAINRKLVFLGSLPAHTGLEGGHGQVPADDVVDVKELTKSAGDFNG